MNNEELYRQKDVIAKYASKLTRVRQLNNPERQLVDTYQIWDKRVLVLGSGAGRVPANLALFGNYVTGIELSSELHATAITTYPPNVFGNLRLLHGDARNLDGVEDESFDCVLFPMNGLDLAPTINDRTSILCEMARTLRRGGLFAFSSHNINAYALSMKVPYANRTISALWHRRYTYQKENVLGGGHLFKGTEDFIIAQTEEIASVRFDRVFCDCRNRLDGIAARIPIIRRFVFPYIMYAFKKV